MYIDERTKATRYIVGLINNTQTWFPSRPSNMKLGFLFVDQGHVLFINAAIFPVAFGLPSMYIVTPLF